jgi:hypothetical protein
VLYKVLKDAEEKTVNSYRGHWTRYEHISKLFKDILAHVEELQYKWSFLTDFNKLGIRLV